MIQTNKKIIVFSIITIILVVSIVILLLQFFSNRDYFSNAYIRENTAKVSSSDSIVSFKNINANLLVPAGFEADFTKARVDGFVGVIKNNDVAFTLTYKQKTISTDTDINTGGDSFADVILEKNTPTDLSNYSKVVENIYRPASFADTPSVDYIQLTNYDPSIEQDAIYGKYSLDVLKRGIGKNNGIEFQIFLSNTTLNESQKNTYLQLGDKILTSIQSQ